MGNYQEIYDYIKTQREVSIPELQKKFSANYLDISKIIAELVSKEVIRLDAGVRYTVLERSGVQENTEQDADDDADDDDNADDYVENNYSEIYDAVLHGVEDGVMLTESDGEHYLVPDGPQIDGKEIRFRIEILDDDLYLTDAGFALLTLQDRVPFEHREVYDCIAPIVERYHLGMDGDELRIKVEFPEDILACMLRLYAAMDRIVSIDEENAAILAERDMEDGRIWGIVRGILASEPGLSRGELVLHMKERYESVKDGGDIDEIVVSARAVKEFSRMSDKDFLLSRDLILKNINGQNADAATDGKQDTSATDEEDEAEKDVLFARERVSADEMMRQADKKEKEGSLLFAIGKEVGGGPVYGDLTELKHILIGGAGGSGKSMFLQTMIHSFLTAYTPHDVRLILCDPHKAEFSLCKGSPYLLTGETVTEADELVRALHWTIGEMERRYLLFEKKSAAGEAVRNFGEYNASCGDDEEKLSRIVIMIDAYENFVRGAKHSIEECVQRLVQKARAAGIHLVIATQDPNTVTGVLKANFSTRIAFRVSRERDSLILLDERGAEYLAGAGAMLMKSEAAPRCKHIQGAYVSMGERCAVVAVAKAVYVPCFDEDAKQFIFGGGKNAPKPSDGPQTKPVEELSDEDLNEMGIPGPLYLKALALVVQSNSASISLVQRKCGIGYNHAGKIIEWMECMGFITPFDGTKPRQVLLTKEEFIKKFGPLE